MPKQKPYKHLSHVPPAHDGMIIFFTVVVYGRRKILNSDLAHETLRGIWDKSGEMNGWFVGDYILMPDHVHFFARAQRDADRMRAWVRMWKSVSARKLMPHLHVSAAKLPIEQAVDLRALLLAEVVELVGQVA